MIFLSNPDSKAIIRRRCSHGNVIHQKEQKETRRTAERLKKKSTRITPHTHLKSRQRRWRLDPRPFRRGRRLRGAFPRRRRAGVLDRPGIGVQEKLRT